MKQRFCLLFTLLVSAWLSVSAYDFMVDGIAYKKNSDGTSVTVTYTVYLSSSNYNGGSGSLSIPEKVTYSGKTYSVTSIGEFAFSGCSGFTGSLTIPNSVTSIGRSAFNGCKGFSGLLIIPNSVISIGEMAFHSISELTRIKVENGNPNYDSRNNCNAIIESKTNTLIFGCCNTIIPNSVTSISSSAFANCMDLASLTIPNTVTSIGEYAFSGCSSLTSITIPNSVISIGRCAFYGCNSLTSVEYNAVSCSFNTSYNPSWFYNCPLTSLKIGDKVETIPAYLAYNQKDLTSITIPNSVTSIGEDAFSGCTGLTSVEYNAVNCAGSSSTSIWFNSSSLISLKIGDKVKTIPAYLTYNQKALTSVTIPSSVTSIGGYAFAGCTSLSNVTIGNSVTSIGDYAFRECPLSSVSIPNSVTTIGSGAFYKCSSLTDVSLGNSVSSIGGNAFDGCSSLTSIIIPNSVTTISNGTFSGCSSLTSITIPNSVTSIEKNAFNGCSALTSLTIPDSVTSIGDYAFAGCTGVTGITIPNFVVSVGRSAFEGCTGLTGVTIGNSVTSIGVYAFSGCTGLTNVEYNAVNYSLKTSYNPVWFNNCPLTSLIIGEKVEIIPAYLADNQSKITSIKIPNSVTSIEKYAFNGCGGLSGSLTIPKSVTTIGSNAFSGCTLLNEVIVQSDYPPTASTNTFSTETYRNGTLYVPKGKYDIYSRKDAWREFANIVEEGGTASNIEGDVNGDGKVDISDINRIINIILGL